MKILTTLTFLLLFTCRFAYSETCNGHWYYSESVKCNHPDNGVDRTEFVADPNICDEITEENRYVDNAEKCGTKTVQRCSKYRENCKCVERGRFGGCLDWSCTMTDECLSWVDVDLPKSCTLVEGTGEYEKCKEVTYYNSDYNSRCDGSVHKFSPVSGTENPEGEMVENRKIQLLVLDMESTGVREENSCTSCELISNVHEQIKCIQYNDIQIDDGIAPYDKYRHVKALLDLVFEIQRVHSSSLSSDEQNFLNEFLTKYY